MNKKEIENVFLGKRIKIINMEGEAAYSNKTGIVEYIDDLCQLHGTWGGLAVNLTCDTIEIIK